MDIGLYYIYEDSLVWEFVGFSVVMIKIGVEL